MRTSLCLCLRCQSFFTRHDLLFSNDFIQSIVLFRIFATALKQSFSKAFAIINDTSNMNADGIQLRDIPVFEGDIKRFGTDIDVDSELHAAQKAAAEISIDKIPFSKTDIIVVALAGIVGAVFDVISILGNSSKNPIGKIGDDIHSGIDHTGNPLDFQGRFDADGNVIFHGDKTADKALSFSGGDHRFGSVGHDIAHADEAIKMYEDGAFRAGGYQSGRCTIGEYVNVETYVNQYGKPYVKLSRAEAVKAYKKHMWADFWSPKGLPLPFNSDLVKFLNDENVSKIVSGLVSLIGKPLKSVNSHLYDELRSLNAHKCRQFVRDLYANKGVNIRSELGKGLAFFIPEITVQIYSWIEYGILAKKGKRPEYSKEAIEQHKHLLLLIVHSIVGLVDVGTVVLTEDPSHLNLATLTRVATLALSCIKDSLNYTHRVVSKLSYEMVKVNSMELKTVLVFANGYYETDNYLRLCDSVLCQALEKLKERQFIASYLELLIEEYDDTLKRNISIRHNNIQEIENIIRRLPISISKEDTLVRICAQSSISDNDIIGLNLKEFLNNGEPEEQ